MGCIQREIRVLENANFMQSANNAANTLAKLASTHVTMSTWLGDVLLSVGDILRKE
jgi:uncharacterized protein with PhoU and TrkA domain